MREVNGDELFNKMWEVGPPGVIQTPKPVVDGTFLPEHPTDAVESGNFKQTNILLGSNKDEGNYFNFYFIKHLIENPEEKVTESEYDMILDMVNYSKDKSVTKLIDHEYMCQCGKTFLEQVSCNLSNYNSLKL